MFDSPVSRLVLGLAMARLTRGRSAVASTVQKEGTKHVPLSRRGKGVGKASARTKANGQVKVRWGKMMSSSTEVLLVLRTVIHSILLYHY